MQNSREIEWSDRDVGQKMSIVIGYALYLLFMGYMAFKILTDAPYADLARIGLAFALGMAFNEMIQRWRQRNAG